MTGQPLIDISQLSSDVTSQLTPSLGGGSPGFILAINSGGTGTQWVVNNSVQIGGIPVSVTSPTSGQVLSYNGTDWVAQAVSGSGTVTSVAAATSSTGLTITGSPITSSGTLTFTLNGELQGLAALSANGFVQRTGVGTYTSANLTSGQVVTALGFTPANAATEGSITSIAANVSTNSQNGLAISGSPVAGFGGILTFGSITGGTGYTNGTYNNVSLTGGSGTGAVANVVVSGNVVTAVTIVFPGSQYAVSDALSATSASLGGTGTGFSIPVASVSSTGAGTLTFTLGTELQGLSSPTFTTTTGFVRRTGSGTYAVNALQSSEITSALGFTPGTGTVTSVSGTASQIASTGGTTPVLSLITTGVTAGTHSGARGATTITIPSFTVDSLGRLTSVTTTGASAVFTRSLFTSAAQGEVPASGGGTTNFLRADGTWAAPAGGGGGGSVTSVAATVSGNGLAVTGSPITTSGTLTFTLGTELQGLSQLGANGFVQRTGAGTYTAAALNSSQITTALGFTPVNSGTTISVTGGALSGGGPLTSSLVISLDAFDGTPGYVPAPTGPIATLGSITGGSGYTSGTYNSVTITGGNGTGALATIVVSGGAVTSVTITNPGTGYQIADALSAASASIGGTGSGFSVSVTTISGETTQYLRADGTWSAPPGSGTATNIAGGSAGQIALQSGANTTTFTNALTFQNGGFQALIVGDPAVTTLSSWIGPNTNNSSSQISGHGLSMTLTAGGTSVNGATAGSTIITGGNAAGTSGTGGGVVIQGGTTSSGSGGTISFSTGNTSLTTHLTMNVSGALGFGASPSYGTSGQVLTSAGSGAIPTWSTLSNVTSLSGTGGQIAVSASTGAVTLSLPANVVIPTPSSGVGLTVSGASAGTALNISTGAVQLAGSAGSSGQVLTSAGSGATPTWTTPVTTSITGGTGVTASGSTGSVTISIAQAVAPSSNVQFSSLGIGTSATGTVGEIVATGSIIGSFSDMNLKDVVGPIENALVAIKSLSGFKYKANAVAQALGYDDTIHVGVSAQAVEKVLPEVVKPAPIDNQYKTVMYERLIPLLIEGIKELAAEVDRLKAAK